MQITNTKKVCLFQEVTGLEQALMQQIVSTVEEAYLADIRNRMTNSINDTVADVLTNLQYNYGKLMPHELLEHKDIFKKTIYNLRYPISTVLSAVEELLKFSNITRTPYTEDQAVKNAYVIIHRTGKLGLAICEWNCMTTFQRTWVIFKYFFGQHTENSKKPLTSLWKTPTCTA